MSQYTDLVESEIRLHLAQTKHRLAKIDAELLELTTVSSKGKVLRHRRDQLRKVAADWESILRIVEAAE